MCNIYREKEDILNLFPSYHVYCHNNKRYLITAKKRSNNLGSNYMILTSKDTDSKLNKLDSYIGKVRSDFMGLEFNAYDNGTNVTKAKSMLEIRKMFVNIQYVNKCSLKRVTNRSWTYSVCQGPDKWQFLFQKLTVQQKNHTNLGKKK